MILMVPKDPESHGELFCGTKAIATAVFVLEQSSIIATTGESVSRFLRANPCRSVDAALETHPGTLNSISDANRV